MNALLRTVCCMLFFALYAVDPISEVYHLPIEIVDGSFRILMGTQGVRSTYEYLYSCKPAPLKDAKGLDKGTPVLKAS